MSISMFLLVPFSCLTGATPFTGDEPQLLPFTKGCCCSTGSGGGDDDAEADSSSTGVFDVTDDTSLLLLSGCDNCAGLLVLTNAKFCGEVGDEGGDFATSSSTYYTHPI